VSENKYVAIGDIHGCARSLEALLDKLSEHNSRKYIFVGDYIDRGPDSKGVVDLLLDFREQQDCVFLRGNHEQMLLDAVDIGELDLWLSNGGRQTLISYQTEGEEFDISKAHLEFYKNTRFFYDTPDYFFVHAGISPSKTISECIEDEEEVKEFLWERSHLNAFETPWEKTLVFGHTPRPFPIQRNKMIGIDTGCVYESLGYGKLTAVLLPERAFVQQTCLDK
jgi:serine/threonine protein phosphatase 1